MSLAQLRELRYAIEHARDFTADQRRKRDFTADQRRKASTEGAALKDGSFVIYNQGDLNNAVDLMGNTRHPVPMVKAHIRMRAKQLGLKLPDAWQGDN